MPGQDESDCVLCKLLRDELPKSLIYEDPTVVVIVPLHHVNPGHVLVIPRAHLPSLKDIDDTTFAQVSNVGKRMAAVIRRSGFKCEGINFFLADGEAAGQQVFHLHLHVYPRFRGDEFGFKFNPQRSLLENRRADMDKIAVAIRNAL